MVESGGEAAGKAGSADRERSTGDRGTVSPAGVHVPQGLPYVADESGSAE